MKVHLEGMGVVGSVTAHLLLEKGVDFTWEELRSGFNAYRASAGGVYPINTAVGHAAVSRKAYQAWVDAAYMDAYGEGVTELCVYLYNTQSAPFGQVWTPIAQRSGLNVAPIPVVSVNTQRLVSSSRYRFAAQEAPQPEGSKRFVSHGFGDRLSHYAWGCTAVVDLPQEERFKSGDRRPFMSLFASRAVRLYVAPLPGTSHYIIGSTIRVKQQRPSLLEGKAEETVNRYLSLLHSLAGITAKVHEIRQGWRPIAHEGDPALLRKVGDRTWAVRPAAGSGVAQAHEFASAIAQEAQRL